MAWAHRPGQCSRIGNDVEAQSMPEIYTSTQGECRVAPLQSDTLSMNLFSADGEFFILAPMFA
jgi:hypothetical protein